MASHRERGGAEFDFWIEEPSFRVHRKTIRWPGSNIDINSEFDPAEPKSPLPTRVHIKRTEPRLTLEQKITVTSVEWGVAIPAERFAMKSMDIPKNTAVVDYRINRRVGYWNGEGLSESPDFQAREPDAGEGIPAGRPRLRTLLSGVTVLLFIALAIAIWRSRARKKS